MMLRAQAPSPKEIEETINISNDQRGEAIILSHEFKVQGENVGSIDFHRNSNE